MTSKNAKVEELKHKIKPCPFCGKQVELKHSGTHGYDLMTYISCCSIMHGIYGKENELIKRWNKRQ